MKAPTELVKGNALILILSCLEKEPMHGYRIIRELKQISEDYFVLGEAVLYGHLHQFESDGLVEGYWESTLGGRNRKLYRLTKKGSGLLARKREEWKTFQSKLNLVLNPSAN